MNDKACAASDIGTTLNKRWQDGWKLDKVLMQDGNTVVVWERRE